MPTAAAGDPLLCSPAVDAKAGRVYIGSEDMCVSAFAWGDGQCVWRSEKLSGVSMYGYHPVVAPDGALVVNQGVRWLPDQPLFSEFKHLASRGIHEHDGPVGIHTKNALRRGLED